MKSLFLSLFLVCICATSFAVTVRVNATATGYTTTTVKTSGNMTVTNAANRGYAVFDLASAGIPAAATITSVRVTFVHTVSGTGSPTCTIYGYVGDISSLAAASLYTACSTASPIYTASWGTSSTTRTMSTTAAADTFVKHNVSNTISLSWILSASTRNYTISGSVVPYITVIYTCTTPTASASVSSATPCSGASVTLNGSSTGGATYSWTGPNGYTSTALDPAAFTVNTLSTGVYTLAVTSLCAITTTATTTVTVKSVPTAISGSSFVCNASTTTLTNGSPYGTWSSSNTGRATVNSSTGVVSGITTGSVNISYSTGCGSAAVQGMTVRANPAAITGTTTVCTGSTTTLSNTAAGGTWTSSDVAVATVNPTTGVVTGVAVGSTTITYDNTCGTPATVSVLDRTAPGSITGSSSVCVAATTTLSNSVSGGTWSSSSSRASINSSTGVVTGVSAGAATITYSVGCGVNATLGFTVNANPNNISGSTTVCTGATATATNSTTGGTWSSDNTGIASINVSSGVFTGIAQGVVNISYTKTGCSVGRAITVKTTPAATTGESNICVGNTVTLSNTSTNGTWSSSNTGRATVNSTTGVVRGVSAGAVNITYSTGCGSAAVKSETVLTQPAAITGTTTVCNGSTTTLANATGGGTWSTSNAATASITSGGVVSGLAQGNATISYSIASCFSTASVLVKNSPSAISGTTAICDDSTSLLTNTANNGTWSSSNTGVASVNTSTGLVTAIAPGSATITYTTGCGSAATTAVSVGVPPSSLGGATSMCTGYTETLTQSVAGGTWSSSNSAIATVSPAGVVTGVDEGSATISYSLINGCGTNVVTSPMAVSLTGKWIGVNSDWSDAANWPCATIPDATVNVRIPAGTAFLPDFSGAIEVKNFTVDSAVTISLNTGATLDVKGVLAVQGTIDGDGQVQMNAGSAQTMSGNGRVSNLVINNTSGVSINSGSNLKITNELTLTAGTLTTNSGLTLASTELQSGRIAPITSGSISGNVNIQQYVGAGRRAYRFFGHPFSSSIALSQLGTKIDITGQGGASNGFTTTGSNAPSAFWYNTTSGNSALGNDPGWTAFTNANASTSNNEFKKHQGIRLFFRGTKGQGLSYGAYTPSAVVVTMTGAVNTGNQTVVMRKGTNSDYNMVSNPYPSPTQIGSVISAAHSAGQVTGSAFYIWNPYLGAAGAFQAKPIGMSYVIGANTSFQVRAASDSATLSFTESDKAESADESILRTAPVNYLTLKVYDAAYHQWDEMFLSFNDNATANEDSKLDAVKVVNPDLNFYTIAADNSKMTIDARPYAKNTVIPVGFTTSYAQEYIIKTENVVLPANATLYLHDKMLNTYAELAQGSEYRFAVTKESATQGENRFEITSEKAASIVTAATTGFTVNMTPNPATSNVNIAFTSNGKDNVSMRIMDVTGATVQTQNMGAQASGTINVSLSELNAGIYMVEVIAGNNKQVQKLVKE